LEQISKKPLTRRANQGYVDIIAEIVTPAPGNRQRVFCSVPDDQSEKVSVRRIDFIAFSAICRHIKK
ncbi:hypothetical protein ACTGVF_11465, partial [Streptococcus suis]